MDADGTDGNAPVLAKRYLHGPAVDQILAQENALLATNDPNRTLWMTTDHLGSVRDVLRNDGTIAAHFQYDSFGAPLDGLENITKFGYAGYERDAATGYYRTQTRWYDPRSGKWLSEDPIGFAGGDANLSRYVGNSASNATDPTGLWTFWNPLTWGVSSPNQGWLETFNPLSRESRAAFGGFYQGGKESGEVMAMGVVRAGGEIGANYRDAAALTIDTAATLCGQPINVDLWSSAGQGYDPSTGPEWYKVSGQRSAETAVVVGRNVITAGAYDLIYAPNRDYLSTGDVQSYSNVGVAALANLGAAHGLRRAMAAKRPTGAIALAETTTVDPRSLIPTHGLTKSRAQFRILKESIKDCGVKESVKFVEHEGLRYIVDGHHRVEAAIQLRIRTVPADRVQLPYKGYRTPTDLINWDVR